MQISAVEKHELNDEEESQIFGMDDEELMERKEMTKSRSVHMRARYASILEFYIIYPS